MRKYEYDPKALGNYSPVTTSSPLYPLHPCSRAFTGYQPSLDIKKGYQQVALKISFQSARQAN
ncbi:hypothetical protein GV64_04125 [Endozoicomonas elysicola]|uniref:Uncharacterized protein n=1 Tax=Endozoicomonas elysicola TaxID=305900 RepID=A0A081K7B4_9GAMM|nr:hypothetical protein GV64_04125 [Endozoicomonas elysicola]